MYKITDKYLLLGDFQGLQVVTNDTEFLLKLDDFAEEQKREQSTSTVIIKPQMSMNRNCSE